MSTSAVRQQVKALELIAWTGKAGNVNQVHLALVLVHGIDTDLARIGAPARMQIATIRFTEIRIGVETANIVALVIVDIVQN